MSYFVRPKNAATVTLNEKDSVKSVLQNIAIILQTQKQSVPLYRDFGLPMHFVDMPIVAARSLLVAAISEAIAAYEPRANVVRVTFELDEAAPGRLIPTVEVEINEQE